MSAPAKLLRRERKPGEVPLNRVPVYDHKGHVRGHVGHKVTEVTISRFTGQPGATLKKKDGRDAWVGDAPPKPPKPKFPPGGMPGANAQPGSGMPNNKSPNATHSLEISLKADKGSNKGKPNEGRKRSR